MSKRIFVALLLAGIAAVLFGVWYTRTPSSTSVGDVPHANASTDTAASTPRARDPRVPGSSPSADVPTFPAGLAPLPVSSLTQAFETSDNLARLVDELAPRARAGDADAARVIAQALDECVMLSNNPNFAGGFREQAKKMPAERRAAAMAHIAAHEQRCRELANAEKITMNRIREAGSAASHGNSLTDQAQRLASSHADMSEQDVKETLRTIVQSRNADAISSLADAMGANGDERGLFGPHAGSPAHMIAWKLVACDLGQPCGPTSYTVRHTCVVQDSCVPGGYREYVRFFVLTPYQYELAAAEERTILEAIANGNMEALFP